MSKITLAIEHPSLGYGEIIASYDLSEIQRKAYNQGRSDALEEFINNVSESIIWDILAEIMKRNISASDGADKIIDYLQKVAERIREKQNV